MTLVDFETVPNPSWDELVSVPALQTVFKNHFAMSRGKGIDRVAPSAIAERLDEELRVVERKARDSSYRFTPYAERLVLKGRGNKPRILSVPSVRDRLLLRQLKEYLHSYVPSSVSRTLPNEHLRTLKSELARNDPLTLTVIRQDIKSFYDSIPHEKLLTQVRPLISDPRVISLIRKAIKTPTVVVGAHRPTKGWPRHALGVPQGLAISNALANLYLGQLDRAMLTRAVVYMRYVDDILLVVPTAEADECMALLESELRLLDLELNEKKGSRKPLAEAFEYLGYLFSGRRSVFAARLLSATSALWRQC